MIIKQSIVIIQLKKKKNINPGAQQDRYVVNNVVLLYLFEINLLICNRSQ